MSVDDPELEETIDCWALQIRAQEALLDLTVLSNLKKDEFLQHYNSLEDRIDKYTFKLVGDKAARGMAIVGNVNVVARMTERQEVILAEIDSLVSAHDVQTLQETLADANECHGGIS